MSTKTKTKKPVTEQAKKRIPIETKPELVDGGELPFSEQDTIEAHSRLQASRKAIDKEKVNLLRVIKYLPKGIDIDSGNYPNPNEIADKKSEEAWEKQDRIDSVASHLSSTAIGPMSGAPIRIIAVDEEQSVPVRIEVNEAMSPEIAEQLGQIVRSTNRAMEK